MHRGEKPRHSKTGEPGRYRLVSDAEIPGSDDRVGAAHEVVHREQAYAAVAHRYAAIGGIVAVVAHHEQPVFRHHHFGGVVELAIVAQLENRVGGAARQRFKVAEGGHHATLLIFRLAYAIRLQLGGVTVNEEPALPDLDAVAGQPDHALDPGLRPVARPTEYDNVAALRRLCEHPPGLEQVDVDRQRGTAVAVGELRGQQGVSDLQRRLH